MRDPITPSRGQPVPTPTASEARANIYRLMDQAVESHQPVTISGKRNDVVLIAAENWRAIQETLHLLSQPGIRESIREGHDRITQSMRPDAGLMNPWLVVFVKHAQKDAQKLSASGL